MRVVGQHYEYDTATNVQTKRYYAEGTLLAVRSIPNANPNAQTLRYVQGDHLGSTSTLTDSSGQLVARERYSAFGKRRRGEMPLTTDQLYTGQQYNSLSGLYHYSDGKSAERFYDPLLARFVQPDPLLPHLASQGLNRYTPNYNNPLRYKDPDGHDPWDVINGANEFAQGFVSQVGYNNAAFLPASQAQLAPREGESDAMTAGRVVGDVVSVGQAVAEGSGGAGLIAGGGVLAVAGSETVVGGVAGAAGVAVGAGMVVHAGSVATAAGSHTGAQIGIWMAKGGGGRNGSRSDQVIFEPRQVQSKFKHALDFGIEDNYNKKSAARFVDTLRSHIDDPNTQVIEGTYKKTQQVTHYYNPSTGLNVIVDMNGNFVSGWRLGTNQAESLLTTGDIR